MNQLLTAAISGLLFGLGITVSGMIDPEKVFGFLDVAGNWDPSLALVLASATGLTCAVFPWVLRRERPVLNAKFNVPTNTKIDPMLVCGAMIFGIGWAILGFCPGPTYATLLLGRWETWTCFVAMIAGMASFRFVSSYIARGRIRHAQR